VAIQKRHLVYVGLFVLMFINYLDRVNLSVAAKSIAENYGLSPIDMGYTFSAFLWTYLVCLIPMGLLADRFGGRAITCSTLGLWSLAGIWTGLSTTYSSLFASRLVLGIGESASYPAGGKIIREWAPESFRPMIISTATISTLPKVSLNQCQRIEREANVAILNPGRRLWRPPAGRRVDPVGQSSGGARTAGNTAAGVFHARDATSVARKFKDRIDAYDRSA
jgi:hypothetical protein